MAYPEKGYPASTSTAWEEQTPQAQFSQPESSASRPLVFEITSQRKIFQGRTSTSYTLPFGGGPSFYAKRESRSMITVHRGYNESGPVIGRIDIIRFESPEHTRVHLPLGAGSYQLDAGQVFRTSGWPRKSYSISLPAVAASMRARSPAFSWRSDSSHGGAWAGGNLVLSEDDGRGGREVAAFLRRSGIASGDGQLEILMPGLDETALEQVVVACIAVTEISRRQRQRAGTGA